MRRKIKKISTVNLESSHQRYFFKWLETAYPKLRPLCFAIPNGGKRTKLEGHRLKEQGLTAGVLDIFFAYPVRDKHGLFLEMKRKPNVLTPRQQQAFVCFSNVGYICRVAYSFEEAIDIFEGYLSGVA